MADIQSANQAYEALIELNNETQQKIAVIEQRYDLRYRSNRVPVSFEWARTGIKRIRTIIKSMKAFPHNEQVERNFSDINQGIDNTLVCDPL
ncbi:hypothetical protein [Halioxenophilus sp. WMMB6]|uniref:hypothetical protein n=1 Tax=Halioxenophilus sp. WMMB6 TaxID=3073815 RepID=UPI00295E5DF6|nr:hypothetical protein [Halioxenophilus sp. WMMB6]